MQSNLISSLAVLSFLGMANSVFLYYKHKKKQPLVCPMNSDCNAVINSKWNNLFGIKNEILGILYYISILLGAIFFYLYNKTTIYYLLLISSSIALLFSGFLMYIQKYKIKEYCFYCIISAIISFLILINMLLI